MDFWSRTFPLWLGLALFKALLLPAYYSTDLDVHRNWQAITYHLPVTKWYEDATSVWTLDYPPLFAYAEYALSHALSTLPPNISEPLLRLAPHVDLDLIHVGVIRMSVLACDFFLATISPVPLTLMALLLVDHVHFQYNALVLAVLLLAVTAFRTQRFFLCAALYCALVLLKHLFLVLAPAFGVVLLRAYVLSPRNNSVTRSVGRFFALAAVAVVTVGFILAPLHSFTLAHWKSILSRLFPFGRGLVHTYMAPNIWALIAAAAKVGKFSTNSISPLVCTALTVFLQLPMLFRVFSVRSFEGAQLEGVLGLAALSAFLAGWHVHEKAILPPLVLFSLAAIRASSSPKRWSALSQIMSLIAIATHLPLLYRSNEASLCLILLGLQITYDRVFGLKSTWNVLEIVYCALLALVAVAHVCLPLLLVTPAASLLNRYPALTLLLVSVVGAVGVIYCFMVAFALVWAELSQTEVEQRKVKKKKK